MISGGRLRWRATVRKASTIPDSLGRRSTTYSNGGFVRVDMRAPSASEQVYADGVAVIRNWEIRSRWADIGRVGLSEIDRLEVRGKTLRINSIINLDERDRVAVLDCSEVA
jgi:hypothetical protein